MKLLIRVVAAVVVAVAFPVRLHANVVLALKHEGRAVGAVGKTCGWKEAALLNVRLQSHRAVEERKQAVKDAYDRMSHL